MIPLQTVTLTHPSGSRAEVALHGGHLISWTPAGGGEAIFLSRAADFHPPAAIRGGVPVVFPQFSSTGPLPKHGFARTRGWSVLESSVPRNADHVTLRLEADDETRAIWPHDFLLDLTVTLGEHSVELELEVHNPGGAPFAFTAALHTYLRVEDVRGASVVGLRGTRFRDAKADQGDPLVTDGADSVRVVGPVDRLYVEAPPRLELIDSSGSRAIEISHRGFRDLVVWNPWIDGAAALPDLADDEYLEMVCVEAAQVEQPVELAGGGSWRGAQRLTAVGEDPGRRHLS